MSLYGVQISGFQLDWNLHRTFCPSSPNIVRTFGNFLGHFFRHSFYHYKCPSHNETRGSFSTIDWLTFYLMRRLELVDRWKWVVYFFCCYFRPLHHSLISESGCSGNDGAGKLFQGNLSSCCFLVAIKFFSHIGGCQCKYAVRFEMKSREEVYRM